LKKSAYKRNRDWVQGYKFHIVLQPKENELLSSWLTRMAFAHGQTLSIFISSYIKYEGSAVSRTDIDFRYNKELFKRLSCKSGLNMQTIQKMSLRSEEGYLFVCNNCLYPPQQIRKLIDKRTHYGLLFCPRCLAEDTVPYFRKEWRYYFYNACPKHNTLLVDRCGQCFSPIKLNKMAYSDEIIYCNNCGRDIRKTRPKYLSNHYKYGIEATVWFENGLQNGYFLIENRKINSLFIFQIFTHLQYLINTTQNINLDSCPLQKEYFDICNKLRNYNSKKSGLIFKSFYMTAIIYHILQNFPHNLKGFAKNNSFTHRDFLHGFKNAPYWYITQIDKITPMQNTVGRTISESEVLGAINYLKSNNLKVTQQSVAEIVGCHFSIHKGFVKIYQQQAN